MPPVSPVPPVVGEPAAWGWVASLRDGGTSPWRDWSHAHGSGPGSGPGSGHGSGHRPERGGRFLPGAQQLELLRRLNLAGRPDAVLVDRVIAASAPGRGRPDLELVGVATASPFGPRPVDPADLPDEELLRVASGLLAEDVVAAGLPPTPTPALTRPWRRPYRLVGVPWLADPLRAELRRRGRPPGGVAPRVLVLGADLATMLALAFSSRAFDEGGASWPEWLAGVVGERRVPPRADLVGMADRWAQRVGRARVRVVLDPADVAGQLGVRTRLATPDAVPGEGVELARLVGAPLGLLVLPDRRAQLLRHGLGPRLVADGRRTRARPLTVPAEHQDWVRERAVAVRDALSSAGYAVVGDPDRLVPPVRRADDADGSPATSREVLGLALRLLLAGHDAGGTGGEDT